MSQLAPRLQPLTRSGDIGALVEVRGTQRTGRARERLEKRFQFRKAASFGIGYRGGQPHVDRHGSPTVRLKPDTTGNDHVFLTEIDTPSRSGAIDVSRLGCDATRSLYSAIARVSPGSRFGASANPGATSPSHSTLSVTSSPRGRSSATRRSSIGPYCCLSPSWKIRSNGPDTFASFSFASP